MGGVERKIQFVATCKNRKKLYICTIKKRLTDKLGEKTSLEIHFAPSEITKNCMQYRKELWTLIVLLLFSVKAVAQTTSSFEQLPDYPFVFISNDRNAEVPAVSDSLFNACARGIQFTVNRTELRAGESFIPLYRNEIVPILRQKGLVLRKILVRGAASPEGPYDNNCRLGAGRTKRLVDFVTSELGMPFDPSSVETSSICEDYEYLIVLMRQAGDSQAEVVQQIWDECGGEERCCKEKLKRHDGGRTWRRLLKVYFPTLRQARVMMWFGRMPEEVELMNLDKVFISSIKEPAPLEPNLQFRMPLLRLMPMMGLPTSGMAMAKDSTSRPPLIALRTNLLHDLFYLPKFGFAPSVNLQLEYFPRRGHLTYNIGVSVSNHRHWSTHKFFQVRDVQLELRRYFKKGHPYAGAYLGAYAHGFVYGIGFGPNSGWEGEGLGAGLSGGYTLPLIKNGHFRLELMGAVGFLATRYDPYVWGNPITGDIDGKYYYDYHGTASKFKKRNHVFTWLGPTNLGVSLTYDIVYRKKQKGGVR